MPGVRGGSQFMIEHLPKTSVSCLLIITTIGCSQAPSAHDDLDAGAAPLEDLGTPEDQATPLDLSQLDMREDAGEDMSLADLSSPASSRKALAFERLQRGAASHQGQYVPMRAFAPDDVLQNATQGARFEGRLAVSSAIGSIGVLRDDYGRQEIAQINEIPDFALDVIFREEDGALIPAQPGWLVQGEGVSWWVMVGQGRSWKELEDGEGWSRAAMPITLVEPFANCSAHGMLTWLYNTSQDTVTQAYYQISQETCLYFKADLWGWLDLSFSQNHHPEREAILAESRRTEEARFDVKNLEEIEALGDVDTSKFFPVANPQHITAHGVLWEGVHYRGTCQTRQGPLPDCSQLVLPSYSTAKSAIAGLSYLHLLGQSPALGQITLGEFLGDLILPGHWREVSLDALLDMRSGHYDSATYMVDEDGARMTSFFLAHEDADKFDAALAFPPQPGEAPWVYHTSDTFLAVRLMQAWLGEDVFGRLVASVFEPLAMSRTSRQAHLRTLMTQGTSQHFGGYGSFWHTNDVLLLASALMAHAEGTRDDLFDVQGAREVLVDEQNPVGVRAAPGIDYHRGFWSIEVDETLGFPCRAHIPFMSGFGGITVAMLPNGAVYYVFADDGEFTWLGAARELAKLGAFCT